MQKSRKAESYLILVAAFWGLTFPLLHQAVQTIPAAQLVFARFFLAALMILPFILKSLKQTTVFLLLSGMILGLLNVGTYVSQTISLETISASRAAFLTGANVLFVPFLSPLFGLGHPKPIHLMSGAICLVGLYLLTGADLGGLSLGDFWGLICAIFAALTILAIQRLTKHTMHYLLLTFYQLLFTALFSILPIIIIGQNIVFKWNVHAVFAVVFCALFATVIGMFIQLRFQPDTTASKAALILALELVFASIFDAALNKSMMNSLAITGSFFILLSIILPEINIFLARLVMKKS